MKKKMTSAIEKSSSRVERLAGAGERERERARERGEKREIETATFGGHAQFAPHLLPTVSDHPEQHPTTATFISPAGILGTLDCA